jgi:short-subunit dehydrogenase involved in D-alanine esterification of teichoic acids
MDLKLKGKTVFISGSTAGIGFGRSKVFLEEGAKVFINGRTEDSVDNAIQRLKDLVPNAQVEGIVADFAEADALK